MNEITDQPFDKETFDAVLSNAISMREKVHKSAGENIQSAQKRQQLNYNRRHQVPNIVKVGEKVLIKNQRREDRKGGKFSFKWNGPYTVRNITKKNLCSVINKKGRQLKTKYNISLLKPYMEPTSILVNDDKSPAEFQSSSSTTVDHQAPIYETSNSPTPAGCKVLWESWESC